MGGREKNIYIPKSVPECDRKSVPKGVGKGYIGIKVLPLA